MTEIGENEIEELFRVNGFTVFAPEQLTVTEQIFYFSTAKEIAAISGTISHNIVFCENGTEVVILNRCCLPNIAQFSVNQISKATITYIDVYAKETMRRPKYWPVWVEINDNLIHYMNDNGFDKRPVQAGNKSVIKIKNYVHYEYLNVRMRLKKLLRK